MARQVQIVTDLSFGDAGKGTTVDFLVRQADSAVVIRHNGAVQAAHNVVTPDGRHHTFAQFGSGSFVPGVRTHLSRNMLLNPLNMLREAEHLVSLGESDIWDRTSVEATAIIITPWQRGANRLRELARNDGRHGSCGQGVGETRHDALCDPGLVLRVHELNDTRVLKRRLEQIRDAKLDQLREELGSLIDLESSQQWEDFCSEDIISFLCGAYREWYDRVSVVSETYLRKLVDSHELAVFEGSQGVLLDEDYGFHPYTTWSHTTDQHALELLDEIGCDGEVTRLGVLRAYTTRHGNGPFVTEDQSLSQLIPDAHNGTGVWQGDFRIGHLDLVAHRYALRANGGVDALVVTGLDRLDRLPEAYFCNKYYCPQSDASVSDVFDLEQGLVTDIRLGKRGDLDYQERLTSQLMTCKPVYQAASLQGMPDRQDAILSTVREGLGTPVALASFGPTATDKRALQLVS